MKRGGGGQAPWVTSLPGMEGSHSPWHSKALTVGFSWELYCSHIVCPRYMWPCECRGVGPILGGSKEKLSSPCLPVCLSWLQEPAHWQLHQAHMCAYHGLSMCSPGCCFSHATLLPQGPSVNGIKCYLLFGVSGLLCVWGAFPHL